MAARTAFPFLVLGAMWEITAHAGVFPPRLFPPLEEIAAAFWRLTIEGILPRHVAETLARLFAGFALAAVIGVTVGIAMGRSSGHRIISCRWFRSARRSPASPMRR